MKNFWNHTYRHEMRNLKPSLQREVKKTFQEFNLELDGESELHYQLICEVVGDYTIEGEDENERTKRLNKSYKNFNFK
tara:strand:- start:217 stop:450 length:234 start_codon:yes stop_codon:yes gene_type:complete